VWNIKVINAAKNAYIDAIVKAVFSRVGTTKTTHTEQEVMDFMQTLADLEATLGFTIFEVESYNQ
jgi:hypothetical protein